MSELIIGQDSIVGPWVCEIAGGTWVNGRGTTLGIWNNGELVGGVLYEDFNGSNLIMHVASDGSKRWLGADMIFHMFDYPFRQLKCKRVTALCGSKNEHIKTLCISLGFELEATLTDAHPDGDMLVYVMRKDTCRWLGRKNVQSLAA